MKTTKQEGVCAICGRDLTDPKSVANHIGPVCQGKVQRDMQGRLLPDANFSIVRQTDQFVLIKDEGPWDLYMTVTNAAEWVVEQMVPILGNRELFYVDSDGNTDQLLVKDGKFAGFRALSELQKGLL